MPSGDREELLTSLKRAHAEHDDPKVIYEATVAYAAWLDFDVKPALTIDDAVPIILASLS